jgi:Ca2+-binding EF-hand superfamily protein
MDRNARTGRVAVRALRQVMDNNNIRLMDQQFDELVAAVGVDAAGTVHYMDFLGSFRRSV